MAKAMTSTMDPTTTFVTQISNLYDFFDNLEVLQVLFVYLLGLLLKRLHKYENSGCPLVQLFQSEFYRNKGIFQVLSLVEITAFSDWKANLVKDLFKIKFPPKRAHEVRQVSL